MIILSIILTLFTLNEITKLVLPVGKPAYQYMEIALNAKEDFNRCNARGRNPCGAPEKWPGSGIRLGNLG